LNADKIKTTSLREQSRNQQTIRIYSKYLDNNKNAKEEHANKDALSNNDNAVVKAIILH